MKRMLGLSVVLLFVGITVWCFRKPLHAQYVETHGILLSKFAESLNNTHWLESPRAHAYFSALAQLQRYQAADRSLPPAPANRIVFYGDSITDFWPTSFKAEFFPGRPYIGRGMTGQSTPEMVWRFQQDVLDLHPSAVVILAGTNDVVLRERHISAHETLSNLRTMAQMAKRHGIRVILCSVLPVANYPPPEQTTFSAQIKAINAQLQSDADEQHFTYVNYYDAMADSSGALRGTFSSDGLHPNAAGYAVMQSLAQAAIDDGH